MEHVMFFSLLQFCPSIARQEYFNVGLVVVVPALAYVEVRVTDSTQDLEPLLGEAYDEARLTQAKQALVNRILAEASAWKEVGDLETFRQKEGNSFTLSAPRKGIVSKEPSAIFNTLFNTMVLSKEP